SIETAIQKAKEKSDQEIFIIGGAEIYKQFLPYAHKIYITKINYSFDGDTFFPELDFHKWEETNRIKGITDDKNIYEFDILTFEKIA
ncbi:MAG: dihydrofolate reductase, partial [Bacteroidetes bacterium]|nr:dihydrofolate reductase [Bacteroidota bacterium]